MNDAQKAIVQKAIQAKVEKVTVPVRKTAPEDVRIEVKEKPLSIAKYIRGGLRGAWGDAEGEKKAFISVNKVMTEGTGTAGGFLVAPEFSTEMIEMLRATSVVRGLGPRIYDLKGDTLNITRQTGATTAYWVGEVAAKTPSDATLGQLKLVLKEVCGLTEISNNLLEDASPAADTLIKNDLVKQLQLAEDLAYLQGTGGVQPLGIRWDPATPGTTLGAGNGATITADDALDAMYAVEAANGKYTAWVMHPRTKNTLRKLKDANGQYIYTMGSIVDKVPDSLFGIPVVLTTQIPITLTYGTSAAVCSYVVLADWGEYCIGQKAGATIKVAASDVAGDAFEHDETWVRATLRVDGAMRQPAAFFMVGGVQV